MSTPIFRKVALERLSSPEQLDQVIRVTSPKGWIAVTMLGLMIAAALAWSVLGSLPSRVSGNGIFISAGGRVADVLAPGSGTLSKLLVRVGDTIQEGQVIAHLSQTEVEQRYRNAQQVLAERKAELLRQEGLVAKERALKKDNLAQRRVALERRLAVARERREFQRQRLADEERLLAARILTREAVSTTRQEFNQAAQEIADIQHNLGQLEAEQLDLLARTERQLSDARLAVAEAKRQLTQIGVTLQQGTTITAPASGHVTEITVAEGGLIREGQSLLTFQTGGSGLELLLYIPPQHGKKVQAGTPVQISPSTAKREEFGTLIGTVKSISAFPVTLGGMRAALQNDELARTFSREGPPFMARVSLRPDPSTVSGYAWTSNRGSTIALSSGTIATAELTVKRQRPITLVIPLLREYTGLF